MSSGVLLIHRPRVKRITKVHVLAALQIDQEAYITIMQEILERFNSLPGVTKTKSVSYQSGVWAQFRASIQEQPLVSCPDLIKCPDLWPARWYLSKSLNNSSYHGRVKKAEQGETVMTDRRAKQIMKEQEKERKAKLRAPNTSEDKENDNIAIIATLQAQSLIVKPKKKTRAKAVKKIAKVQPSLNNNENLVDGGPNSNDPTHINLGEDNPTAIINTDHNGAIPNPTNATPAQDESNGTNLQPMVNAADGNCVAGVCPEQVAKVTKVISQASASRVLRSQDRNTAAKCGQDATRPQVRPTPGKKQKTVPIEDPDAES